MRRVPTFVMALGVSPLCSAQDVRFVNPAAPPGGNGLSWATAFVDLQDALAVQGSVEVWVAAGTYRPDRGTRNRNSTFVLGPGKNSASVFGGFRGDEVLRTQRDPTANITVLSGDLLMDDGPNFLNNTENAYIVVSVRNNCVLDGVVVRGATVSGANLASGGLVADCQFTENKGGHGAGLRFVSWDPAIPARVERCRFIGNIAADQSRGGGIDASGGGLSVTDCIFQSNLATGVGGGAASGRGEYLGCTFIGNSASDSSGQGGALFNVNGPLEGCVFVGNSAAKGGAVCNTTSSILDCEFRDNSASDGGALYVNTGDNVGIRDCTFTSNHATRGGALGIGNVYSVHVVGCDFIQNAGFYGGALNQSGGRVTFVNSRFLGNTTSTPSATGGSGGAAYLRNNADLTGINCHLSGNHAEGVGGAIASESLARLKMTGCTVVLNDALIGGGGFYSVGATGPALHNCILWDNEDPSGQGVSAQLSGNSVFTVRYSTVEGWAGSPAGEGNSGADPLLVDPDGPDDVRGTTDDNGNIPRYSPAVDSANNADLPPDVYDLNHNQNFNEPIPFDLAGNSRMRNDPNWPNAGAGSGHASDRGALEFQPPRCIGNCDDSYTPPVLNVNDFLCFQNLFALGSPSANCDGSSTHPVLNVNDFLCFINSFAQGCP